MKTQTSKPKPAAPANKNATGRLFFLEASGGRIHSANADGSDRKVIVTGCRIPDGVVVDVEAGHIYWTNMGVPNQNDGSIERADLDGQNRVTIIGEGETFTPKQLHFEKKSGKLYWCDREGMRVMRANLDGSEIETLVDTSKGDARPGTDLTKWCVGITVDPDRGQIYWTDRGDPPRGNTVNRALLDADFKKRPAPEILLTHLMEGIGIALDLKGDRMFLTDLAGTIYSARLDGSEKKPVLVVQGNITGIAYAEINTKEN